MCDYSLEQVASRPAQVGDKLITTIFNRWRTVGFCAVGESSTAVCIRPGTELAFENEIETLQFSWLFSRYRKVGAKVARFRRVNQQYQTMHHDALELPEGLTVLLTTLRRGQLATVLQLPSINSETVPGRTKAMNANTLELLPVR